MECGFVPVFGAGSLQSSGVSQRGSAASVKPLRLVNHASALLCRCRCGFVASKSCQCSCHGGGAGKSVLRMSASASDDTETMLKQVEALEKALQDQTAKLERLEKIKDVEYMNRMSLLAQDDHKVVDGKKDPRVQELLKMNKGWRDSVLAKDPTFFEQLNKGQTPEILWIGCADSRVPANQILNLMPGEVFVTRNIANVVVHTDINCLSVMEYAVKYLKVKRIVVCGHYACGGVKASMSDMKFGAIDNWLRHIRDVRRTHAQELGAIADENQRFRRLCELNVMEQVQNVVATTIVQNAWDEGSDLTVHAWIYDVADGLVKDLGIAVSNPSEVSNLYRVPESA
mmetsp:Transcript_11750/g.21262  ORF Transcript_11750/g.21262 Transcript_11750/m.21262 type:complete len:342 (-) Transcript_11750:131-1156(-)